MENQELLQKLVNADGIAGHEQQIRDILVTQLQEIGGEISSDNLGSFICKIGESGPKIMLAAHMDEVGFVVRYIDENGFIFFTPVGGWWNQVMLAQKVKITTANGLTYYGVIGSKPPHVLSREEREKPVKIEDMFIDLGVKSKKEVEELGIKIGDMITPVGNFEPLVNEKLVMGKAFDNRVGCYIIAQVMEKLSKHKLNCQVYGVATVQEEIGLRGATTSANKINPDIAIAIDTGIAGDTPKMTINESMSKLGEGPQIMVLDATTFGHPALREKMLSIAKENDIKVQLDYTPGGGTDAGRMHLAHDGALGMSASIATRYIHSHLSIIDLDDVENLVDLMVNFCLNMNQEEFEKLRG